MVNDNNTSIGSYSMVSNDNIIINELDLPVLHYTSQSIITVNILCVHIHG